MDEITILDYFADEEDLEYGFYRFNNDMIKMLCTTLLLPRTEVPRILHFTENTVPRFSSKDFRNHFRLDRVTFEIVLEEMAPSLTSEHLGGKDQLDIDKHLLLFVWYTYLANQESMREASNLFGISISTVHVTIMKVSRAFNDVYRNIIRWPNQARQNEIANAFQLSCGIPGVVGTIDGTHIRLSAPIKGDQDHINRKGFPSVVLQVVVDDNLLITSAQTGWPGCSHDGRVLRNTELFHKAEAGNLTTPEKHLFGDSAYPLKNWLITPFRDNGQLNNQQHRFNRALSSCRQTVERAIGHLKGRFRKLREITFHNVEDICYFVMAVCKMHNLCIIHEDHIEEFINNDDFQHPNQYPNIFRNAATGIVKRNNLMNNLP